MGEKFNPSSFRETLKIDPEFKDKIPPMPKEDFDGLREDILRDGYVRDPIVVWREENTILDGHHRWIVIQENWEKLKDKFSIDYKSFPNRHACIAWICANQLHKHNMNEMQRMKLIQEEYDARQKAVTNAIGVNQYTKVDGGKNLHHPKSLIDDTPIEIKQGYKGAKTRQIIAKEHNITEGAVKTAVEFGRGVDKGEEVCLGFKNKVLTGEVKATKSDISTIRKMEPEERKKAVEKIISGEKPKATLQGYKKQMEFLHDADKKARDADSAVDFTGDMLVDMVRNNTDGWASSLKNMLVTRSTYLVGDTRDKVAKEIEEFIKKINNIKEILK